MDGIFLPCVSTKVPQTAAYTTYKEKIAKSCYKPQYNSFKIVFDLQLINAIDLHYRHRMKIYFIKKEMCALELKETENIIHFLLLKAHPHSRFQCSLAL